MLLPDGLSTNAYRILRLSANASSSEVHKAAERARRASALGMPAGIDVDSKLLGPLPQTDADIRAAVGSLGNGVHRLKERLFWFHHVPGAELPDPSAPGSEFATGDLVEIIRRHDEALRGLFNAFHATLDDAGAAVWVRALRRWHTIVSDDSYWALSVAIENRGAFEPRALPAEVESVKSSAVSFAAHGLMVESRDAVNRDDTATVQIVLGVLGALVGTGSWAHTAQDEIASDTVTRFTKLCSEIREEGRGKVIHERYAVAANRIVSEATLDRYRREVAPQQAKLVRHFPADHDLGRRVRESAAHSLYGIAADFTWADEFVLSESLHEEALELAKGTGTAVHIEGGLAQVRQSARTQRSYAKAKPIKAAPSLRTINGFGVKLYGNSDVDSASGAYTATYYAVALFLPVFPLARYRVMNAGGNSYRFLGKLPLRKGDRWHQAIVVGGFLIWLAMASGSNPGQGSYGSSASTYSSGAYPVSTVPSGGSYAVDSAGIPDFSDLYPPRTDQNPLPENSGTSQRSDGADLLPLIDNGRARMRDLEARLTSDGAEIESLTARLSALGSELEILKERNDAGTATDISEYNSQVDTYNDLLRRKRLLVDTYNANVNEYQDLGSRDKRLVAQYNSH
jgi:hypothetical protein